MNGQQRQLVTKDHTSAHSSNRPSSKLNSWLPPASYPSPTTIFPISANGKSTGQAVQTKSLAISLGNFFPTHVQSIIKILPAVYQNISQLDYHAPWSQPLPWPKPPLGQCLGFLIITTFSPLPSASVLNTAGTMNLLEGVRSSGWIQKALVSSFSHKGRAKNLTVASEALFSAALCSISAIPVYFSMCCSLCSNHTTLCYFANTRGMLPLQTFALCIL